MKVQRYAGQGRGQGEGGEDNAFLHFWLLLPNTWVLVNDAVLGPDPGEFAQIDHVLIGPPGIFLVETKAWEGAFLGYQDVWKRKEGNSWVRCESPHEVEPAPQAAVYRVG